MNCPHCNHPLKDTATFCPHCGSDKNTGWSEGAEFSDLESPDYEEILENEFWESSSEKKKTNPTAIIATVIVALAFVAAMVFR